MFHQSDKEYSDKERRSILKMDVDLTERWIKILLPSLHHFHPWSFLAEGISSLSDCWYPADGHFSLEISQWPQNVSSPLCPHYGTPCRPVSNNQQASIYLDFSAKSIVALSRTFNFKIFFMLIKILYEEIHEIMRYWVKIVIFFYFFSPFRSSFIPFELR